MNVRPSDLAVHRATTAATAAERNRAAAALHQPNSRRRPKCTECDQPWPCRTTRILRGDQ